MRNSDTLAMVLGFALLIVVVTIVLQRLDELGFWMS